MKASRKGTAEMLRRQKRLGIKLLIVGALFVLASVPYFIQARQFTATASHATGKILSLERRGVDNKDSSYFPVFSFTDPAGTQHIVHSRFGSHSPDYAVGDTVDVLYPAEHPEEARINSLFSVWGFAGAIGGSGLIFAIAGIVLVYYAGKPVDEVPNGRNIKSQ